MRIPIRYTFLGFYLNMLLDRQKTLSVSETKKHIDDGSLFDWLKDLFGDEIDLSLYQQEDKAEMLDFFQNLVNAVDEDRKMGVKHNGISLLLAYCIEGVQQASKSDGKDSSIPSPFY